DIRHATVTRGGQHLIRDVDWQVELDERWVVLGPNGAGKTTLLNLAAARLHPSSGTVDVLGERLGRVDVFELRTRIGLATVGLHLGGREDLVRRLAELAADPDAPAMVLVTHHVEEIPPGFTHALLLREGGVVASGLLHETVTSENLSKTFDLPLRVDHTAGRF